MDQMTGGPRAWLARAAGNGRVVVRIGGELDLDSVADVAADLDALLACHAGSPVDVDLAELAFLDSSGVAVLIRIANGMESMRIVAADPPVRRVIEVLGLAGRLGLDGD